LDQCTNGTQQPGTCEGAKVCCEPSTPVNPLSHLAASAREVGLLLANRFSRQTLAFNSVANLPGDGYKTACEWYGALGVAKLTNSTELLNALVTKFDPLKNNFVMAMTGGEAHVDRYIFGMVPLEIYIQTNDMSYLPLGTQVADRQQTTNQTRDAIDDMFMMTGLQLEAYRATKDAKYIDFMSKTMVRYLMAQQSNGLFFHNVQEAKVHWGRGNGWFAAGMAEIMRDLPTSSADYMTIEAGYKKMMDGLRAVQSANGLWYQVLDQGSNASNWEESSGSAMFTYAMVAGVRRGVLDAATFVPVIEKAWAALQKKISPQGDVSDICVGTWYKANAAEYMALTRLTGDGHGQAPVLWAAVELLK
jgi:rhamnogalacturonyl hydrolase YesR